MKRFQKVLVSLAASLTVAGCYDFVTLTTVMYTTPSWSGANSFSGYGDDGFVLGLAGPDIYRIKNTTVTYFEEPLLDEFGGPYTLSSIAQTNTLAGYEHTFVHGERNWAGENLNLLYTESADLETTDWDWVTPLSKTFKWYGATYEIEEICEIAAASVESGGAPYQADAHLFMSIRACPISWWAPFMCVGGVIEVGIGEDDPVWWPETASSVHKVWIERPNGNLFSDECMPISVTRGGQQTTDYLVVGDPSEDEFTLFDAQDLSLGPLDSVTTPDSNDNILDLTIEGRREDTRNYGFIATLWGSSTARRVEHTYIMNGAFIGSSPFLVESVASDVEHISSRGLGADGITEQLYTFGDRVVRRRYAQD